MQLLSDLDNKLTKLIRDLPPSLTALMSGFSFIGQPLLVIISGLLGYMLALHRHQNEIEHAFIYAAVAFFINTSIKLLLRRARPHGKIIKTLGLQSYSFPSGHAFGTVIFYGLIVYLAYKDLAHPWNILLVLLIALGIFFIGVSRVYLQAHYPTDVLAGWIIGLLSLIIIIDLAF